MITKKAEKNNTLDEKNVLEEYISVEESRNSEIFVDEENIDDEKFEWTAEEEQKVLKIIDVKLMPFILLMTFVLNMDRTNISNAISDNLANNLGFTNDGVNTGTLIYSFIFTVFTLPSNVIVKHIGAHLWIPVLMSSWAIVTWAHVFIHNFSGFIIVRVFIAITEAGFIPGCLTYLTGWYKTTELATRLAWFWGIQYFASAFSGLIAFGLFRLAGTAGLAGWKWLFLIDGLLTHVVGTIAFFYLPASPSRTAGIIRGKGWFTERQTRIAIVRTIRDDNTKKDQYKRINLHDAKIAVLDTKLWTHLIITFVGFIPSIPIQVYLPTIIRTSGFSVTDSNLLTAPSLIISLVFSIMIAKSSDKFGYIAFHGLIGVIWTLVGYIALEFLPENASRWSLYGTAFFAASSPSWNGIHIAWMSSNLAPIGKRTLALGAIIGAANISGVPGSQIYKMSDSPHYHRGNWINIGLQCATIVLFLFQYFRYTITNSVRQRKWDNMTEAEKKTYCEITKDEGSNRLDFRFRT